MVRSQEVCPPAADLVGEEPVAEIRVVGMSIEDYVGQIASLRSAPLIVLAHHR